MLLPTQNTALRRELEKWFRTVGVEPAVVAEFEDGALAKIVATEAVGVTVVPTVVASEAVERYGFSVIGRTEECRTHLYLITAERRIEHPAVTLLAREGTRVMIRGHRQARNPRSRTPKRAA